MTELAIPAFIAGLLTFLAPCTLPLLPAYLGFIGGDSAKALAQGEQQRAGIRSRAFINGLFYVIGFSLVFIALGLLFGLGGGLLVKYRDLISRIGGALVIFFGLFMLGVFNLPFLNYEKKFLFLSRLEPGKPLSAFIFGATFAFGWTPCVGPILGAILTLAATTSTAGQGAILLTIFSLGLAVPFLLVATLADKLLFRMKAVNKYLKIISIIGGLFLIALGILLVTNQFTAWIQLFYKWFDILNYEGLLEYL